MCVILPFVINLVDKRPHTDYVRLLMQNTYWCVKSFDLGKRRNYDARITHRLTKALSTSHGRNDLVNYFYFSFSPEEIDIIMRVAAELVSDLHEIFNEYYYKSTKFARRT